jgi:hypothetical protein
MEATPSFDTSVPTTTTRRHIAEDGILQDLFSLPVIEAADVQPVARHYTNWAILTPTRYSTKMSVQRGVSIAYAKLK